MEDNSYHHNEEVDTNMLMDLNKKRKLQAEQLGLPIPKHTCWDRRLALGMFEQNRSLEDLYLLEEHGGQGRSMEYVSDAESAKDSNSFIADCDSVLSAFNEPRFENEVSKASSSLDRPSTSSMSEDMVRKDSEHSSYDVTAIRDAEIEAQIHGVGEEYPFPHYDEPIVEYGCHEHGNDDIDQYMNEELDEILRSHGVNPNMYVLSSGRWTINQDSQPGTRKPTIDQEFEQYFATLML